VKLAPDESFGEQVAKFKACLQKFNRVHSLTNYVDLDAVVEIDVPDAAIVERMSGRRVHLPSGRTYHVKYNPPKVAGKDDETGEDLVQRDDDKEETVKKRLAVYHEQTEVLVDFYSKLTGEHAPRYIKVDGTQPVETVKENVITALQR